MDKRIAHKIIISHPTGNSNVRAIVDGLHSTDMLLKFVTTIASFPGNIWDLASSVPGLSELKRRSFDPVLRKHTSVFPWIEIGRMLSKKSGMNNLTAHELGMFCVDQVYRSLDRHVSKELKSSVAQGLTAVYAYEDGAFETFKVAKELGLLCVYDLPIAYWETGKTLMMEELERLPRWSGTLGGGVTDSTEKTDRKTAELEMADLIVTPGSFVAESIKNFSSKKVIMSPFGSPAVNSKYTKKDLSNPLRILFVGSMGQRKGLSDLFEAIKMLNTHLVELVVLGSLLEDIKFYKDELPNFIYEPTRSHHEVLNLMSSCHIFCLPSIVEGRALVIQEAMSQGLPIIITPNTGGEDLVIEGQTGFLVPIRSPERIAESIAWFLSNRNLIHSMGICAQDHAAKYSWSQYSTDVINEINNFNPHL
jgi:glycosyltransferase involved in cell wall biosynthesis